jgi:hypothetical protein
MTPAHNDPGLRPLHNGPRSANTTAVLAAPLLSTGNADAEGGAPQAVTESRLDAVRTLVARFKNGFGEQGFSLHDAVEFVQLASGNIGVRVRVGSCVTKGEILMAVPRACVITGTCTADSPVVVVAEPVKLNTVVESVLDEAAVTDTTIQAAGTIVAAMYALASVPGSLEADVAATWPALSAFSEHPLLWTPGALKLAQQGPRLPELVEAVQKWQRDAQTFFNVALWPTLQTLGVVPFFARQHRRRLAGASGIVSGDYEASPSSVDAAATGVGAAARLQVWELYRHAAVVVASRAFKPQDLIPLLDLINGTSSLTLNVKQYDTESCCVVRATRDLSAGEQLLLDYGAENPPHWLVTYAFCPSSLPPSPCVVRLAPLGLDLNSHDKLYELRRKVLGRIGWPTTAEALQNCLEFNFYLAGWTHRSNFIVLQHIILVTKLLPEEMLHSALRDGNLRSGMFTEPVLAKLKLELRSVVRLNLELLDARPSAVDTPLIRTFLQQLDDYFFDHARGF